MNDPHVVVARMGNVSSLPDEGKRNNSNVYCDNGGIVGNI